MRIRVAGKIHATQAVMTVVAVVSCTVPGPRHPGAAVVSGVVRDEHGSAVAGACVRLAGDPAPPDTTGPSGEYSLETGSDPSSAAAVTIAVTHPWYDSLDTAVAAGAVDLTLRFRRLRAGEYFRVLTPVTGHAYAYDRDTMIVAWLQNVGASTSGIVSVSSDAGLSYNDVPSAKQYWNMYPRDLNAAGYKSYRLIDTTAKLAIGIFRMRVSDTVGAYGPITFAGDSMCVRVWDPYPSVGSASAMRATSGLFGVQGHP